MAAYARRTGGGTPRKAAAGDENPRAAHADTHSYGDADPNSHMDPNAGAAVPVQDTCANPDRRGDRDARADSPTNEDARAAQDIDASAGGHTRT